MVMCNGATVGCRNIERLGYCDGWVTVCRVYFFGGQDENGCGLLGGIEGQSGREMAGNRINGGLSWVVGCIE